MSEDDEAGMVEMFPHSITLKESAKGEIYWEFKLRFPQGTTAEERAWAIEDQQKALESRFRKKVGP